MTKSVTSKTKFARMTKSIYNLSDKFTVGKVYAVNHIDNGGQTW